MLVTEMPKTLHRQIKQMSEKKMAKVMDMMKIRMRFHKDIQNHKYLFEDPDFVTELA